MVIGRVTVVKELVVKAFVSKLVLVGLFTSVVRNRAASVDVVLAVDVELIDMLLETIICIDDESVR